MSDMQTSDLRLLWIVGSLERLAGLGLIKNVPFGLTPESQDVYSFLDAKKLFPDSQELLELFHDFLREETPPGAILSKKYIGKIEQMLVDYKENPEKVTQGALKF